jgi:hypothetical protein
VSQVGRAAPANDDRFIEKQIAQLVTWRGPSWMPNW